MQQAQPDGKTRLKLAPAPDRACPVGRPGMVVDADQPRHGQQRLTGGPDTQQVRRHRPGRQLLTPAPQVPAEVAVEPARSPGIRGKRGQRGGWIRAREMDAVMAEEDPQAVPGIGLVGQIRSRGRREFHTPADAGVPRGKALSENGSVRQSDRQQVTSDEPGRAVPLATDP